MWLYLEDTLFLIQQAERKHRSKRVILFIGDKFMQAILWAKFSKVLLSKTYKTIKFVNSFGKIF